MTSSPQTPDQPTDSSVPTNHPQAFKYFFWGEFAERSSFYGMKAILPVYLLDILQYDENNAGRIVYGFKMACYLLPLLGGFLADRYFGKYWTIVGFSIPYVLGHFILGIENHVALFIALTLLAGGSGVIKPNISSLMGQTYDQLRPGQDQLRSSAFMWYYFAINIGAFISQTFLPEIRTDYGYTVAFQIPAWLMIVSFAVFALGKKEYAVEKIETKELTPEDRLETRQVLRRLFGIFFLVVFFWIAYEQSDSAWVFFIRKHVDLSTFLPWRGEVVILEPDQLQAVNPWTVMVFAPLFGWLFPKLDPRQRFLTPGNRMFAGFLIMALASGLMSAAGFLADSSGAKVSVSWAILAYFFLTIAEILVYGTGLEFCYAAAPKHLKGFVTACFLVTSAIGNLANMGLAFLYNTWLTPGQFFGLSALIALAASIRFYSVSRSMNQHELNSPA